MFKRTGEDRVTVPMKNFTSLVNELKNNRPESEGCPGRPNGSDKNESALFSGSTRNAVMDVNE